MKKIITLFVLLISLSAFSQEVNINLSQDARLALIGDNKGNDAFTPNLRLSVDFEDNNGFYIAPEIEYADLKIQYLRYSGNIGKRFIFWKKLKLSTSIGFGIIDREGRSYSSFSGDAYLSYPISKRLRLFLNSQIVERKDLKKDVVISVFFGVRYRILKY